MKYRWRLKRLYAKQKKIRLFYDEALEEAKKEGKAGDDIESLHALASDEDAEVQEKIDQLITFRLLGIANKLIVPVPEHNHEKMWKECHYSLRRKVLTAKGVAKVRKAIRLERRDRRDAYVPLIAALTGVIGAITGLVAVIYR